MDAGRSKRKDYNLPNGVFKRAFDYILPFRHAPYLVSHLDTEKRTSIFVSAFWTFLKPSTASVILF